MNLWEGHIKQNPALSGICCSQLVLVTQTLPKKVEAVLASSIFIQASRWSFSGRLYS